MAASYYHSNGYGTYHQFDNKHDSFQIDQAALTLAYQPKEGFGALVNVAAGEDMKILNAAEGSNPNTFDIVQGFVQYATGPLTVIGGKFVTLAGAEVIAPTGNTNFSRSLLFYAEPLTHTGIRATYAASDTRQRHCGRQQWVELFVVADFRREDRGVGHRMDAEQAVLVDGPGLCRQGSHAFDAQRTLVDAVATYNATAALTFILSYDWGKQEQHAAGSSGPEAWNGAAFYTNYRVQRSVARVGATRIPGRQGWIRYCDAVFAQTLKEGTVTFGYDPVKSFELRLEARYDKSTQPTFVRSINEADANPLADSQTGLALQGVYKF